ncbi:MAG: class I SAM-dependent methyltransferase [Chloroflexota bacterium]
MASVHKYPLDYFGRFIADPIRMGAYRQALKRAVRTDSVVLDIGTGTGVFAFLAAQFGARRVLAVEPHDVIEIGQEVAAANGLADRIEFIQALTTDITLPEKADIIVSDLHGVLPLFQNHISTIADARERLLAPGGTLIPQADTMQAALIHSPDAYERTYDVPWLRNDLDIDMSVARWRLVNDWHRVSLRADQMVTEPRQLAFLDYHIWDENTCLDSTIDWEIEQPGEAHGAAIWFDSMLLDGVGFSNQPADENLIYGQAFFPLEHPVTLTEGDMVQFQISAKPVDDRHIWHWTTTVTDPSGARKARYQQSTVWSHIRSFPPFIDVNPDISLVVMSLFGRCLCPGPG